MTQNIGTLTVSQLNRCVKFLLEEDDRLRTVWVSAEISNFTAHGSGHWYFTLKDPGASLSTVMFREENQKLSFLPKNGIKVLVRGHVSLYERDGKYQFYAEDLRPDGHGALHLSYEELKERLTAEGLFEAKKKKKLPHFPHNLGVITSKTGAALQDILQILRRRCPIVEIFHYPVQVQGTGAAEEIVNSISFFNNKKPVDLIILARGGGSLEDLWTFNEESVVRAVASSKLPIISAVGHETDVTLCDFAADFRAPTPSAAAEISVPDRTELLEILEGYYFRNSQKIRQILEINNAKLAALSACPVLKHATASISAAKQRLDNEIVSMERSIHLQILEKKKALTQIVEQLDALSPLRVLARGYASVTKESVPVFSTKELTLGEKLHIKFHEGTCNAIIWEIND